MIQLGWLDLARIVIAGALLGVVVGKLVVSRPYYLDRLRPRFWRRVARRMDRWDWLRLFCVAIIFAGLALFVIFCVKWGIEVMGWELFSEEEYVFARLKRISWPALLITVNILPVFEEWIFRGILLEEASRRTRSRVAGVLISALIFGAFHLSNPGTYLALAIPSMAGGVLLGICYLFSGLAGAIVMHCIYNTLVCVFLT